MRALAIGVLCLVTVVCCKKKDDVIVETAAGISLTDQELDGDPWALLPPGALALARVDTPLFFSSTFGQRLRSLTEARVPLPASANFDPQRDLSALHIGVYSMQGADMAGVAKGRFDPAAIDAAADGTTVTPLGAPLVKTTYGGRTLYVSRNIGFVVLTEQTVLFGNETGIRRALDRLEQGEMSRQLPKWMTPLLDSPRAALVLGADLEEQPTVRAALGEFIFVKGLSKARMLGNFEPPGMNIAGTLSYVDEESSRQAVASLIGINQTLRSYSWFLQLAGIGTPIQRLEATPSGKDAQFVMAIDGPAVEWLINQLANQLGVPQQTIQATESAPVGVEPSQPSLAPAAQ